MWKFFYITNTAIIMNNFYKINLLDGKIYSNKKLSFQKNNINNWYCERFFPWENIISNNNQYKDNKEDAIIVVNSIIPKHFKHFWNEGLL